MQNEMGQLRNSSSRLGRQLQIDMRNPLVKTKHDQKVRRKYRKSKTKNKINNRKLKFNKVKSEPFVEFEWFCLDCEECIESDCQHYNHPRCLINGDLNDHFDATGHSWAQPIRNFVKTENICLIKDLKHDPTYRDLLENL